MYYNLKEDINMRRTLLTDLPTDKHLTDFTNTCNDDDYNQNKRLLLEDNFNVFNQSSAEAMIYYFLLHNPLFTNIEHDKKLYPQEGNSKDVDVVGVLENKLFIRIEVKAPEMPPEDEKLHAKIAFRAANNLEAKEAFESTRNSIVSSMNRVSKKQIVSDKLDDLKIKTYIESANGKFHKPSANNEINVLFVSTSTSIMLDFLRYYTNPATGVFSDDPYFDTEEYLNVDYIVFSNSSECHLDDGFTFNVWDLKNYLCFVLPLRKNDPNLCKRLIVDRLFDSKLAGLSSFHIKNEGNAKEVLPVEFWSEEYIALNYPQFCCNLSLRKY